MPSNSPEFVPELRLLLAACAPGPRRESPESPAFDGPLDEKRLWDLAVHHRLVPAVHEYLTRRSLPVSPLLRNSLRNALGQIVRMQLELSAELLRLDEQLTREGIPYLTYKGPSLARELYGGLGMRHSGDLDLMVHREDVPRVKALLEAEGYVPEQPLIRGDLLDRHLSEDCELNFDHPARGLHVEVHWEFLESVCRFDCSADFLWRNARSLIVGSKGVPVPGREELFVALCIHGGYKHEWKRLKWLVDVARGIAVWTDLDFTRVVEIARELGHERMVAEGALLSTLLLDVHLPEPLVALIDSHPMNLAFTAMLLGRLGRVPGSEVLLGFTEWRQHAQASGVLADEARSLRWRLRYLRAVLTPGWSEIRTYGLSNPPGLRDYWRSLRHLFHKHGTELLTRLR